MQQLMSDSDQTVVCLTADVFLQIMKSASIIYRLEKDYVKE